MEPKASRRLLMTQHRKSQCARWRTGGCTAGGIEHKAIHGYRRLGEASSSLLFPLSSLDRVLPQPLIFHRKIVRTLIPAHRINGTVDEFIQRGSGVVVVLWSMRPSHR